MTSKKTKRYDVPTVKHNRRKVNKYKFKKAKFKRSTDLLPLTENNTDALKAVLRELKVIKKKLANLEEPEEEWIKL